MRTWDNCKEESLILFKNPLLKYLFVQIIALNGFGFLWSAGLCAWEIQHPMSNTINVKRERFIINDLKSVINNFLSDSVSGVSNQHRMQTDLSGAR